MSATRAGLGALLAAVLLAACGPGNGGDGGRPPIAPEQQPDSGTTTTPPDAGPTDPPDAGPTVPPDAGGPWQPTPGKFELPPLQTSIPEYRLYVSDSDKVAIETQPACCDVPLVVNGTFKSGSTSLPMTINARGASSRAFDKKSWNIDLGNGQFGGRDDLKLIAEFQDQTLMAEKLAYDLLWGMGVKAPRGRYVAVWLNDEYKGIFLDLDKIDGRMVKATGFADKDATIFRAPWKNSELKLRGVDPWGNDWRAGYQGQSVWVQKNHEEVDDLPALDQLLWVVNRTPDPDLPDALETVLDTDQLMKTMAIDAVMSNNFVEDSESYLIHDHVTGKWSYVPWDFNNSDARWWPSYGMGMTPIATHPLQNYSLFDGWTQHHYDERSQYDWYTSRGLEPNFSNLNTRVMLNPELRERSLATMEKTMAEVFNNGVLDARIDAIYALLLPYELNEPGDTNPLRAPYVDTDEYRGKFKSGPAYLKAYVTQRAAFVKKEIARLRATAPTLTISRIDPHANAIELVNRGATAIDLGAVVVTKHLRESVTDKPGLNAHLPAVILEPGATTGVVLGDLGITLDPAGEVGLFDGVGVVHFYDAAFYGQLDAGQVYQRELTKFGWLKTTN